MDSRLQAVGLFMVYARVTLGVQIEVESVYKGKTTPAKAPPLTLSSPPRPLAYLATPCVCPGPSVTLISLPNDHVHSEM